MNCFAAATLFVARPDDDNFRFARHPSWADAKRGDHILQADLSGRIRTCGQNKLYAHLFGEERVDVGFEDHQIDISRMADRYPILTVDTTIDLEEGKKLRHSIAATEVTNDSAILHLAAQLIHRKDPQSDC